MIRENFLANGGHVLVRTEAARRIGGFDATLRLSEDRKFWCRLTAQGAFHFIGRVPEVFSLRVRPGSAFGPLAGDWANHRHSLEVVLDRPITGIECSPLAGVRPCGWIG